MSSVESAESVEEFRAEFRGWLRAHLTGRFADLKGRGGPGREHEAFAGRLAWERHMAEHGWTCVGRPVDYGGRGASTAQQVAFHEEYALADAPARVNHIGEQLLGPTLIDHGTDEQKRRFLPPIRAVEELWCQGYSEPDAGSDLAGVRTRAALHDGRWTVDGQKTWTSLARANGAPVDPLVADRLARAWTGLQAMRATALRPGAAPSMAKLYCARWHRDLGELAMDVCGAASLTAAGAHGDPYELDDWQRLFLFSRADTLYAGSDEIQRNIVAERILGLPKEVRA
ncbi:acyl-CoA dehydrogenase family protein [Streptomyces lavendulae]|uniref:acyl-CoA dehydrogenase family protein n=1 Tax=Streptomyces lavendulae TaxID=1914 RepID=UPI0024A1B81E|nr:acyl-CoA dehydrogenase family protein [Streptomyces lavendulae]GLX20075.1 hypothetical protein Slala01_37190 [Streptomyces lavendulae subsp. lavendulae]GLX27490.1 hypothetical protein Slala02_33100 [Streptomyces lavendulae subsp. lavendulae]